MAEHEGRDFWDWVLPPMILTPLIVTLLCLVLIPVIFAAK